MTDWLAPLLSIFRVLILVGWVLLQGDEYRIYSNSIVSDDNETIATGDVLMMGEDYVIRANEAKYDKNKKVIELFGDVYLSSENTLLSRTNYAFVNTDDNTIKTNNVYFFDKGTSQWIVAKEVESNDDILKFKSLTLSSCNYDDPDWYLSSSSILMDKKNKWLHIFNPLITLGGVPVFYFPYLGVPTDTTRRSGLLRPSFAFLQNDGLSIVQPYYVAPDTNWDIEFDPQYRALRGLGLYSTLRLVLTPDSMLTLNGGYFQDYASYTSQYSLANSEHFGAGVNYANNGVLFNTQDMLYVDYKWLNDVDYLNLKELNQSVSYDKIVTSRINYVMQNDYLMLGLYPKYYFDTTSLTDNKETLQLLPQVQLHKFSTPLFVDNLLYSIDLNYKNYTRAAGSRATKFELLAPLGMGIDFWDYLRFDVAENIYFTSIEFDNGVGGTSSGNLARLFLKGSVGTDLSKDFGFMFHTVNTGGYIIYPHNEFQNGNIPNFDIVDETAVYTDSDTSYIDYLEVAKSLNLYLNNYFYISNFFINSVSAKLTMPYYFDTTTQNFSPTLLFADVGIAMRYGLGLGSSLKYSHLQDRVLTSSNTLSMTNAFMTFSLSNSYNYAPSTDAVSQYLTASANKPIGSKYSLYGNFAYDISNDYLRSYQVGFSMNKRCWNYNVSILRTITPILTTSGIGSISNQSIYFKIAFNPIGGIEHTQSF